MNKVFLSIGSNIGNKRCNLEVAAGFIESEIGFIEKISSAYETEPWGLKDQPDFLNRALLVYTKLNAEDLLKKALAIELDMGRVRHTKMGARIIDIDLLLFNDEIIALPDLHIPHPLMHERNFVLMPMDEISPDTIHPTLKKSMHELLQECRDTSVVRKKET